MQRALPREYSLRQRLPTPTVQTPKQNRGIAFLLFSRQILGFFFFFFSRTRATETLATRMPLAHCTQYIQLPSNFTPTFPHSCFTIGEQTSRTLARASQPHRSALFSLRLYVSDEAGHQFFSGTWQRWAIDSGVVAETEAAC